MNEIFLLKSLADDEDEFITENGEVIFQRHGKDYSIIVRNVPNAGMIIKSCNGEEINKTVSEFIQSYLLDLPRLASQINRTLETKRKKSGLEYIEAPAIVDQHPQKISTNESKKILLTSLNEPVPFSSQIIHLMATAGQGKTVLLEELAISLSQTYTVNDNPLPILLPIDLLGRYIGTIDDAIAGSLNNTYNFPRLSQKDIVLCLKKNWICLALDGFDELVARVGSSDAFSKITDLLDQLEGNGSIILSARDNFFESHHIIYSMQSFLRPQIGSYTTIKFALVEWEQEQVERIFKNYGSNDPHKDYLDLKETFGNDINLLTNPFFLTKICKLWFEKKERFSEIEQTQSHLSRINYIIEIYLKRETEEKWINRDGKQIIPFKAHNSILGYIAEEMWRTSSFKLSSEELKLSTQIACSILNINADKVDEITERIPTHAVFDVANRLYSFSHDQFFYYYFGFRIAARIVSNDFSEIDTILSEKEINPLLASWIKYNIVFFAKGKNQTKAINELQRISAKQNVSLLLKNNIGVILSSLISVSEIENIQIQKCVFSSDCFKNTNVSNVSFSNCEFWKIDLSGTAFNECNFENCSFSDIKLDEETLFQNVNFGKNVSITQLSIYKENFDTEYVFSPFEIRKEMLRRHIIFVEDIEEETDQVIDVKHDVLKCIMKFIKQSNKFHYVSIDEMLEEVGRFSKDIAKIGLASGIFNERIVSGTNQRMVVFTCDKNSLLEALRKPVTDTRINDFWAAIVAKF